MINRWFDRLVGLHVVVGRRVIGSWRFFSVAAFLSAAVVWAGVGLLGGVRVAALLVVAVVPAAAFEVHRWWVLRSDRPVRLVLHQDVAAWVLITVPALALLDSLTGAVADAAVAAVLTGNAVGRIGCLRSGCCTGIPARIGPSYAWLGPGRRWPVQVAESLASLGIAASVVILAAAGVTAGRPALTGLLSYALSRFTLDYLRAERAALGRPSEAQWVMVAVGTASAAWLALG